MWNILCLELGTFMLGRPVSTHDATRYADRYQKIYPQYEFDVVKVESLPADSMPGELYTDDA